MRKRDYKYTEEYLEFCMNDGQREVMQLAIDGHTTAQIGEKVGLNDRNVYDKLARIRARAERHGFDPDHDLTKPQGLPVSGASTLYTPNEETGDLELRAQWVKTNKTAQQMIRDAELIIEEMAEELPKAKKTKIAKAVSKSLNENLINLHVLTDFHLGVFAWADETHDAHWDTEIAEDFLMRWFEQSLAVAPSAATGILSVLGDFLHADGLSAVTPGHGHVLDADSRYAKVVRIAIRCIRRIVKMMLEKYEKVHLIISAGNHDESGSVWLRELFFMHYSEEPRIEIDNSPSLYHALQFGKTGLYFHHGHRKAPRSGVDTVFAGLFPEMFGATKYRYAHLGHKHSKDVKESNLMLIEQHATMTPNDSYASGGGWLSQRSADVITYHKEYGKVGASTMNPGLVEK